MIHDFDQFNDQNVPQNFTGFRLDVEQNNPLYQVYNQHSADLDVARRISTEIIHICGADLKIHPRTDNNDVRDVHDEDPDPTYWSPSVVKGFFVPKPLEYELQLWGLDAGDAKTEVVFSLGEIFELYKERLLRPGDIIEVPYNSLSQHKPRFFVVDNAQENGNYRYTWLYLKCQVSLLPADPNLLPATDDAALLDEYS